MADPREKMAHNFGVFQGLLRHAEESAARAEGAAAAGYAQIASNYAFLHHTGLWSSPRLERILADIGSKIPATDWGAGNATRHDCLRRILHVLTEAYSIGGHTRLVWRWIEQDENRLHSVAITRQGAGRVPSRLAAAVRKTGGRIDFVDAKRGGMLSWARALRSLAVGFDRVVLHMHPSDVMPLIAFAEQQGRPPLVYVNHADHVFWLGIGLSDVLVHLRHSGTGVSTALRGVEKERCVLMPVPLNPPARTLSRSDAKQRLGLPEDAVVLLSIAAPYKYDPILGEASFVDAVFPVLQKHRKVVLLAVGPGHQGQWEWGSRESQGRVKAYGKQGDTAIFYQAADIYLDPFPVASTTSFLEAGSYGLPLVSFCAGCENARLLCGDSPELEGTMIRTRDLETYRSEIADLIVHCERRAQLGKRTKDLIINTHVGKGWGKSLDRVYTLAAKVTPVAIRPASVQVSHASCLDIRLSAIYDKPGASADLNQIVRSEAGLLPLLQRLKLWARTPQRRLYLLPLFCLPEWARKTLRRWITGKRYRISREPLLR